MGENLLGWMVYLGSCLSKGQAGRSVGFSFMGGGSDKDFILKILKWLSEKKKENILLYTSALPVTKRKILPGFLKIISVSNQVRTPDWRNCLCRGCLVIMVSHKRIPNGFNILTEISIFLFFPWIELKIAATTAVAKCDGSRADRQIRRTADVHRTGHQMVLQ